MNGKIRNLFLIVEGPDAVGKTTLIQNIRNYFNKNTFKNIHFGSVKHSSTDSYINYNRKLYNEMFQLMINDLTNENSGIIFDRSHLGEMVYGPIYRNYTGEYVLEIENNFKHILSVWDNLFLITLIDEPARLVERDLLRGDGLSFTTDVDRKKHEIDNFSDAHSKSGIRHKLIINIKDKTAEDVKLEVIDYIEKIKGLK